MRIRAALVALLAAAVVGPTLHAPPAGAVEPTPASSATAPAEPVSSIRIPELVTEAWNGSTGVNTIDDLWRKAVLDVARLNPEPEIREAATVALASGDPAVIYKFANVDKSALDKQVAARKKKEAADNLATIKALKGTGGPYFKAEVDRVLAGSDSDRVAFLAYGADIARDRDKKVSDDAAARAATLRERVRLIAAMSPAESNVKRAAEAAFAGDDAAINTFLAGGYLTAARADAAEREQYLKDLEARNKAAEELSELAKKSAKANEARQRLLVAHGAAVRALQQASNAMGGAANASRHATRVLAGSGTATSKTTELAAANAETKRQLGYAQAAALEAERSAQIAKTAANDIVATGLEYGAEWAEISQGMSEAATAAVGATQTAVHATDATVATNNAQGAQAQAEAHAQQAIKWREHAQEHARSAAKLAAAAAKQATAAKTAAARAKKAREQAQAAEAKAWAEAEKTRQQREIAEAQAAEAKRQRQIAETERDNAARHRAEADRQAAIARSERANAEAQAAAADSAARRAQAAEDAAGTAADRAWAKEGEARVARDEANAAERAEQTAKAKQAAWRAGVAGAGSVSEKEEAQRQADAADREADSAGVSARSARSSANAATGAAANARAAATQAQQAANRAFAAARQARAAAAAADAAATKAESSARATHAARVRADAKAAEATAQQVKAARAAQAAVSLAQQAADEAVASLRAADRTRAEAEAATTEAVAASAQADVAVNAASAARQSAAGIAAPRDAAIGMVSPFTGADIDADFVKLVAEQAAVIGAEQAAAAQARAQEALAAAVKAQAAADLANEQVPAAYTAAAQAARSAAAAAQSAAEAKKYAAQAAVDGAAARVAAASAGRADAQAKADALAARQAANEAANDAAIAGRAADQAQAEANAANSAANAAESDAAAARDAASRAEASATEARQSAENAQKQADDAATAAGQALKHAAEAQAAAQRAEDAERKRQADAIADAAQGNTAPSNPDETSHLSPELQEQLRQAEADAGLSIMDFLEAEGDGILYELSGAEDIVACFREGNVEACLWSAASLFGPIKAFRIGNKLIKLIPKIKKFLDKQKSAEKRREELRELARTLKKQKDKEDSCDKKRSGSNSFLPGTPVLLADGTSRPIEQLELGDLVLATDPADGITAARPVTDVITGIGVKQLVDVVIDIDGDRGNGTATVTATHNHPFWVPALSDWVEAELLAPQQWLRTSAGSHVQVSAVRHHTVDTRVHNLTVDGIHSFYVLAGDASVLVHNDGDDDKKFDTSREARREAMRRAGLPTSLQPVEAKYYYAGYGQGGGYQYVYRYNGQTWLVTDNWNDLNADVEHGPHWEVGVAKPGGQRDSLGRLRVGSGKSKANYKADSDCD